VTINERIIAVKQELPAGCELIIVSKNRPIDQIAAAYEGGNRIFAENRVQNLLERYEELPKDISWHLIGHLQTNKVKYIAPFVAMIHSLDSMKLAEEINKQGEKNNRIIPCLLQIHVAQEASKFGIVPSEVEGFITEFKQFEFSHIQLKGIMGMASFVDDNEQVKSEFRKIKSCFDKLKAQHFLDDDNFCEISMGMSSDYKLAINEGSTMVRIGSLLFE
jgi:pyridoxal phosphate enzyme (YggS family)